jgi:hypothetical protein
MTTFISYFSKEYVIGALASIQAATLNNPGSTGLLVCVDIEGEELLSKIQLPNAVSVVPFEELVASKSEFARFTKIRSKFEALVSIKPVLLNEISDRIKEDENFIYLDTDLYFFSSINDFLYRNKDASFIVFQHMYGDDPDSYPFGKYNAGLVILKKNSSSKKILEEWARLCSEWCYLRSENGRYADQGYLDNLINTKSALGVRSTSINLGMHYPLNSSNLKRIDKQIQINGDPLICFHFHGLRIGSRIISTGLNRYGFKKSNFQIFKIVYKPVINLLKSHRANCRASNSKDEFFLQEVTVGNKWGNPKTLLGLFTSLLIKTYVAN